MATAKNLQEETAFLNSLLEQQISIEEGLNSHEDLQRYLNKVCFKLELAGYDFPHEFTVPQFVEGLETLIAEDQRLEEEGNKPFLQRAVGAVKGAMSRGLAALPKAAHNKLRQYHAAKADAAMDTGNEKAYIHHYQAQHFHLKHGKPEQYAQNVKTAKTNNELTPGSKKAGRMNMFLSKASRAVSEPGYQKKNPGIVAKLQKLHAGDSSSKPPKLASSDVSRTVASPHSQKTDVTRTERPTEKHNMDSTKAMKITPKAV